MSASKFATSTLPITRHDSHHATQASRAGAGDTATRLNGPSRAGMPNDDELSAAEAPSSPQHGSTPTSQDRNAQPVSLQHAIALAMMEAMTEPDIRAIDSSETLCLRSLPVSPEVAPYSRSGGDGPVVTFRPGPQTVRAIITAAALIASADGQVSDAERRSLLHFLRRHGMLERHGRAAATTAFDQAVRLAVRLGLSEDCEASDQFRAVATKPGAPLVAHAAAVVALADGIGWPKEIALLERIRDQLGLPAGPRPDTGDLLH